MAADSIEVEGVEYIPAKRAAKLVGYSPDYVGQLARADKLEARVVGRSWYVTEDSIRKHKLSAHRAKQSQQRMPERVGGARDLHVRDADNTIKNKDKSDDYVAVSLGSDRPKPSQSDDRTHSIKLHTSEQRKPRAQHAERELARAHVAFSSEEPYRYTEAVDAVVDSPAEKMGVGSSNDTSVSHGAQFTRFKDSSARVPTVHQATPDASLEAIDGVQRANTSSASARATHPRSAKIQQTSSRTSRRRPRVRASQTTLVVRVRALIVVGVFLLVVGVLAILFW